jgi:acyl-CoA synthetase (AMP-forming)/AMP-acid ligase II
MQGRIHMSDICVHIGEMLARNARMYPGDTALIERAPAEKTRAVITWRQFDERANRVAHALVAKGVQKGDRVLHLMHNSIDWLVAYFGIIRSGAWVVPLNFRFTGADLKYCANAADPKLMVFGEEFIDRVQEVRASLPGMDYVAVGTRDLPWADPFHALVADARPSAPGVEIALNDPCGLYFTSGTTGQPKPILLTHNNMAWASVSENVHHRQTRGDNFILIPPLYHTGAAMHWLGSFIVGAPAVILKGVSAEWVLEAVSEEGGTIVFLLVPWAQDIMTKLDTGELRLSDYQLDQWRLMHMGAQPVPASLVARWRTYFSHMDYDTNYGLSESTGPGCVHLGTENSHKIGAIGLPGFNWEARVVDEDGHDMAGTEPGELIVRGNGVMREYYKNPEATAKAIKDGWLYTGDMVRRDEDGFLYIVDRKKDVIITGGENVYPVEVEEFFHTHPSVKDVAVIGLPDERLGEIVAVVIDVKPGHSLSEDEVLAYGEELPRYKRPRKCFFSPVPRNPTGKVEKPKLRKQFGGTEGAFTF